jgi:DNA-binding response OmpR family regulator
MGNKAVTAGAIAVACAPEYTVSVDAEGSLMDYRGHPHRIIRFGAFRADLDSGELFKDGQKVRLTEQPFQFLATLLERPGEIVSRDELRRRLWPTTLMWISTGVSTRPPARCETL